MLERVKGIEPSSVAWEATALPLSYTRDTAVALRGKSMPHAADVATHARAGVRCKLHQNLPLTVRKKLASLPPFWPTVMLLPVVMSMPNSLLCTP